MTGRSSAFLPMGLPSGEADDGQSSLSRTGTSGTPLSVRARSASSRAKSLPRRTAAPP